MSLPVLCIFSPRSLWSCLFEVQDLWSCFNRWATHKLVERIPTNSYQVIVREHWRGFRSMPLQEARFRTAPFRSAVCTETVAKETPGTVSLSNFRHLACGTFYTGSIQCEKPSQITSCRNLKNDTNMTIRPYTSYRYRYMMHAYLFTRPYWNSWSAASKTSNMDYHMTYRIYSDWRSVCDAFFEPG